MSPSILAIEVNPSDHLTTKVFGFVVNVDDLLAVALAMAIILGLAFLLRHKTTSGVPGKLQLAWETIVEGVTNQVNAATNGRGGAIVPLAITLFIFILICNWLEFLPSAFPGHHKLFPAPTGDINLAFALAILVIILVHATWIRQQGLRGYLSHYTKPFKIFLPINIVETIAQPLTLALRLFGNIFAGGIMLLLISEMPAKLILPIPVLSAAWLLFDVVFVAPIQAFIFTLLTILYFGSAYTGEH